MKNISEYFEKAKDIIKNMLSKSIAFYKNLSAKKKIAAGIGVISVLALIGGCIGISLDRSSDFDETYIYNQTDNSYYEEGSVSASDDFYTDNSEEEYEEEKTATIDIGAECDKVIAFGYDSDNNYYEMVANQSEDYNGVFIEIGFSINNSWVIEPTNDWPFIDSETGMIERYDGDIHLDIFDNLEAKFIGNGCFYMPFNIINLNTGDIFELSSSPFLEKKFIPGVPGESRGYAIDHLAEDGYLLLYSGELFNTNTMEYEKITYPKTEKNNNGYDFFEVTFPHHTLFPYSEGLYAAVQYKTGRYPAYDGFYNSKGERVIDLSSYNLIDTTFIGSSDTYNLPHKAKQALVFEDGYATFDVANDAGSVYRITIDKTGEVVESVDMGYSVR